ncbi:MAG: DUF3857 domain-containing protein [Candidatus Acidiferrales bacterium]
MNRTIRSACIFGAICVCFWLSLGPALKAGDTWLPIPPEDLAMKDNPASPGANAMILYRENTVNEKLTDIDGPFVDEYIRIKIFTQQGTSEGDVQIPFFKGLSNINDIRARTIHPDGSIMNFDGKVFEKVVVRRSGVKFLAKTFTLPDVQPGSIIEYRYRLQHRPRYIFNERWDISGELFTREAKFAIIPYHSDFEEFPLYFRLFGLPAGEKPARQADGSYTMTVRNIAGVQDEPLMPPRELLETRVEFFHRDMNAPENETMEHFWARTDKKWNEDLDRFINKKSVLQKEVSQITSANDSPDVKLRKIYARVQKIRNLSVEPEKTEQEQKEDNIKKNSNVEDVLSRGYATGHQANYAFVGLARAAGFDAAEVYVAPRNTNMFFAQMQDADQLSADIVWVKAGNREYYLDPASQSYPFGLLPWYESETKGLRVGKQADFVDIPKAVSSDATTLRQVDLVIDSDGNATGKIQVEFTGQRAATRREADRNEDQTGRKKEFEDLIRGWLSSGATIELVDVKNWDDNAAPLVIDATVKIPGFGMPTGHRMLMPATIFEAYQVASFETAKRSNPVYFSFPYEETDDVKLHVPAGFKIETIPASKKVSPGAAVSYDLSAAQEQAAIEVKRHLAVNGCLYSTQSYGAFRAFFDLVKSDDESQIVLQNAETAKNN